MSAEAQIRAAARRSPDLRAAAYAGRAPLAGHCYVASEALYHAAGGASGPWKPETVRHEGGVHWYLRHRTRGHVLDLTAEQFTAPPPYAEGRGRGFLTKQPSRRAAELLRRAGLGL